MQELKTSWISISACCLFSLAFAACAGSGERDEGGDDDNDDSSDSDTGSDTGSEDGCGLSEMETFDTEIPAGWTVIDNGVSAGTWTWTDSIPETFPVAITSDGAAIIDSQAAGDGSEQDDDLESPTYDLGDCTSADLSYDHNFQKDLIGTDVGEVYLVPGEGGTPVLLASYSSDSPNNALEAETISITSTELGDETTFKIVFHYEGAFDLGWYVDNVGVEGVP
jgi:hypothetical protein